jgi:4-amino-4-deoxy-L-arabinose transferase-like glycosyltransferase
MTMSVTAPVEQAQRRLTPVPWWWVGGAALVGCALLLATASRYGYHRDELYFRMLPPAWGYVDQPPLTPLLAKASILIFGDTPAGMRVPAVIAYAAFVVLVALTTRELGGGRAAQAFSAWSLGFAAFPLLAGHMLVTGTLDLLVWGAVLLFVARALLRAEPRWWLLAGAVVGVGLYNKLLVAMLLIGLAVGFLAVGPRSVLRSRHLWAGVGIALLIGAPNFIYQATHGLPQLTMAGALSENNADEVRIQVLPMQFVLLGPLVAAVWIAGMVALLRRAEWRPLRAVVVAYGVALALTLIGGGQIYYATGLQIFLLAAGWVPTVDWIRRASWRGPAVVATVGLHAAVGVLTSAPVLPVTALAGSPVAAINPTIGDQVGWPEYVRQIGAVWQALPPEDQARAVFVTGNYGEAGAIDRFGGEYGLPSVYSAQNELYYLGPPPADRTVVLLWSEGRGMLRAFDACEVKATLDHGYGVDNEEQGSMIAVCRLPEQGWAAVWPSLQHYD